MRTVKSLLIICFSLIWGASAFAAPIIQSAPDVAKQVNAGEMVLLDIRSVGEWRETGLAAGAWPVSMHSPDFRLNLEMVLARYKPSQIAIICATGGRTAYIQKTLDNLGVKGVTDLSEGMIGNHNGPGWLARKMPIITLEQSQADFEAKFAITK
jgi:rhodanese-related sulfurtransferase